MKKLMILAAIALVAVTSQAAKFNWSAKDVQNAAGTGTYSGSAMLFAYLSTAEESTAVQVEQAQMVMGAITTTLVDDDDLVAGNSYKFYYTMEDMDGNTFKSTVLTRAANKSQTIPVAFGSSGSWTSVPEPTSGLLLLLGVAGLALRRKQK